MNYNKRVDKNQQEIVAEFRRLGFSVYITSHVGAGFPDLMAGKNGKTILIEIKSSESAKWTTSQLEFMSKWQGGTVMRVNNILDVQKLANMIN